jgi:CheY-like chemotaxis protein
VRLEVSDNGCGIEKETQALIFEPFFTTKGVGAGTGLGLATVYGIIKQNEGFICVNSELGHGSTFTIYLPRYTGVVPDAEPEVTRKSLRGGEETILLVEDDPAILQIATTILREQGYRLLMAGSPEEALRLAQEFPDTVHLLVSDVIMPEMNGMDLAKKMTGLYPHIKCLFVSGYTAEVITHQGVLGEGVHFLQKPFSMDALSAKVRELLDIG